MVSFFWGAYPTLTNAIVYNHHEEVPILSVIKSRFTPFSTTFSLDLKKTTTGISIFPTTPVVAAKWLRSKLSGTYWQRGDRHASVHRSPQVIGSTKNMLLQTTVDGSEIPFPTTVWMCKTL